MTDAPPSLATGIQDLEAPLELISPTQILNSKQTIQRPVNRPIDVDEAVPLEQAGVGRFEVGGSVRPDGSVNYSHPDHVRSGALWAYIVIVIIIALAIFILIWNSNLDGWYDRLDRPGTLSVETSLLIWFFAFIIVIIVAYVGHVEAMNGSTRMLLTWAFLLQMVSLIVWATVFYGNRNATAAFYLSIITLLLAIWWLFLAWNVNRFIGILLLVYVIWIGYITWSQWQILDRNPNSEDI